MAYVSALVYYPIKGCGGVVVDHVEVAMTGLLDDRLFAVVGLGGETLWQGAAPHLATIRPRLDADGATLVLRAPGTDDLTVSVAPDGPVLPVDVEKWPGTGIDQGDDVATWLSDHVGKPARLVREPARAARAGLPDPTALHITSDSSLDHLNTRIGHHGARPVPMARFRPNIVITDWSDPYTEDHAHRMSVGTTVLGFGELAIRCAVTTIDQETGDRRGPEPLRTLARYRREPDGVSFGLKASVLSPGRIAVKDPVTITTRR